MFKLTIIFITSLTFSQLEARLTKFSIDTEGLEQAIERGTRNEIYHFFGDLKRSLRSNLLSDQAKVDLAVSLYRFRNDTRPEEVVSEDEIAPSIRSSIVSAMVSLTDYEKILNAGKIIDYSDPFRPHQLSGFIESDFFSWFEKTHLKLDEKEAPKNKQRYHRKDTVDKEQSHTVPSASKKEKEKSLIQEKVEQAKSSKPILWGVVSALGMILLLVFFKRKT